MIEAGSRSRGLDINGMVGDGREEPWKGRIWKKAIFIGMLMTDVMPNKLVW